MTRQLSGRPESTPSTGVILSALLFLSLLVSSLALSGCDDTTGKTPASGTESFTFGGTLYVANGGDGSLIAFDPLSTNRAVQKAFTPIVQDENIVPSRRFPESVSGPTGIFLDRSNDTLYVANTGQNAISIYDNASGLTAPFSATRVISGSNTMLDQPFGITFDPVNQRIFVANKDGNSILLFEQGCAGATTLVGNISPCRVLLGTEDPNSVGPALFPLDLPRSLAIDTIRDILYISNMGNDSILVYDDAGNLGGIPGGCITSHAACNQPPSRTISPHTDSDPNTQISKLELPFGIFVDATNDRLYVVNSGLNTPGIFIYETASTKVVADLPDRVIAGLNTPPLIDNKPQLTVPSGIDVDTASGRLFIINNNSPNNVNQSGDNVDSPSLLVFNDINTTCTLAMPVPCNIAPSRRIGGDVFPEASSTLSSPTGIAFDPIRDIIYVTNTGANNLFLYAFSGDITPLDVNADLVTPGNTSLEEPSDLHYDMTLDRLFVANFGSAINVPASLPVLVYDNVGTLSFNASAPSWSITGDANLRHIRGLHVDKSRGYFLTLNGASTLNLPKFSVYCIPTSGGGFNPACTALNNQQWFTLPDGIGPSGPTNFPTNTALGPENRQLRPPDALRTVDIDNNGGTINQPTAMEVDESRGEVYIADQLTNSIFVYHLDTLAFTRTITGVNTLLNQPHGLSYDVLRDILYVTNAGDDRLLLFDNASTKTGNIGPDRIVTTATIAVADADKLKTPIAPQIDSTTNRLFLISSGNNAIFIYENAAQLNGEISPNKQISGAANTLLDFTPPQEPSRNTGALLLANQNGSQTIFVGQPESPICTGAPNTCPTGALLVFGQAGRVPPSAIWKGGAGNFTTPAGVAVDVSRNVLYVTNQSTNTLSILNNANQLDVNMGVGAKTELGNIQLNSPGGLVIDSLANRLYIANSGSNQIVAFDNPNILLNGSTPDLIISDVQLNGPQGLAIDSNQNRIYVANTDGHSILSFDTNGAATPGFSLSGANTQLASPIAVAIDTVRDDLYVLNNGASEILIFENISTINGNFPPGRVISGNDGEGNNFMTQPSAIFIDSLKDLLYVADRDSDSIYFFTKASTAQGQAEHSSLSGDNTGLNKPSALFVDTTVTNP